MGERKQTQQETQNKKGMTDTNTDLGDEDDPAFVDARRGGATHQS